MSGRRQGEKRKTIISPTTTSKSRRSGEPGDQVLQDISTAPSTSSQKEGDLQKLLRRKGFQRWIKCIGAMYIARNFCIEPVERAMKKFHSEVTKEFVAGQPLSSDKDNAASFENKVNNKIKLSIRQQHRFGTPNFGNADIARWQESHWEVAKCFISTPGYQDKASAEETDFGGIISIIIGYKGFQKYVKTDLKVKDNIFKSVREIRNTIIHKGNYDVDEHKMNHFFRSITKILLAFENMDAANVVSEIVEVCPTTVL